MFHKKELFAMFKTTRNVFIVAVALVAAGCAQPPQAQIDAAKAALDKATAAQAVEYAPESYAAARDAQAKLDAELTAQSGKFALTRSYGEATTLATAAVDAGNKAAADAVAGKQAAQTAASAAVKDAETAISDAETALNTAPKGKGSKADLDALKADVAAAKSTLGEAQTAATGEHYSDAKTKATAAKEKAAGVKDAIDKAVQLRKGAAKG
jgi:colicin import membrane protein